MLCVYHKTINILKIKISWLILYTTSWSTSFVGLFISQMLCSHSSVAEESSPVKCDTLSTDK